MQFSASVLMAMAVAFAQPGLAGFTCTYAQDKSGVTTYSVIGDAPWSPDADDLCRKLWPDYINNCAKDPNTYTCDNKGTNKQGVTGVFELIVATTKCGNTEITSAWEADAGGSLSCSKKTSKP